VRPKLPWLPLLAGSLFAALPAGAQVPDTYLRLHALVVDESDQKELDGVPGATLDVAFAGQFVESAVNGAAHAFAGGGGGTPEDPPIAECSADLAVTGIFNGAEARATAIFRYSARITGEPPSEIAVYRPPVFVRVRYAGETALEGNLSTNPNRHSSASASVSMTDGYGTRLLLEQAASTRTEPFDGFDGVEVFAIDPLVRAVPIDVLVRCDIALEAGPDGTAHAHALADPIFELDQAAFDEWAASQFVPSFPLADHFDFEYSAAMVPEPGGDALAAAAIATLGARARRRAALRGRARR